MESNVYSANLVSLRKNRDRYLLKLLLTDLDATITIDMRDTLCETLGVPYISSEALQKIFNALPKHVKVIRKHGYWRIQSEGYILSSALANLSIQE